MIGERIRRLLAGLLFTIGGCGSPAFLSLTDPASMSSAARADADLDVCDPNRPLRMELVFEGTTLGRELPALDLPAAYDLAAFDSEVVGVETQYRRLLLDRIVQLVADAYAPFGIEVTGDDVPDSGVSDEFVSRVILTQVDGGPGRCRCQGATGRLGLTHGQASEGLVLANAFRENGLARAIAGRSLEDRIELMAVALSNSIVHEAGHTFGLVHLDLPGAPTLFMARGGAAQTVLTLADMTRVQAFSSQWNPVTDDARGLRDAQCDTCLLNEVIEQRRYCGDYASMN